MAKRIQNAADKSKPFTTINLMIPMKISVCGDDDMQRKWRKLFPNAKVREKTGQKMVSISDFVLENIRKDLKINSNSLIFEDVEEARHHDKLKMRDLMIHMGQGSLQGYLNFIIDRHFEKLEREKEKENAKKK